MLGWGQVLTYSSPWEDEEMGSKRWGHHLADPGAGTTQLLVPRHVFDHTAKRRMVTANAPSVLIAQVTDKLRSAPVTLLDQGDGAAPRGE